MVYIIFRELSSLINLSNPNLLLNLFINLLVKLPNLKFPRDISGVLYILLKNRNDEGIVCSFKLLNEAKHQIPINVYTRQVDVWLKFIEAQGYSGECPTNLVFWCFYFSIQLALACVQVSFVDAWLVIVH